MAVVYLDVCPKCQVDVSRRFGLIRSPIIACHRCGYQMRVTQKAVSNNWQYNIGVGAMLIIWLILACLVLLDPKGAVALVNRLGKSKSMDNPWLLAGMSFIPAFFLGLPFALIGRIKGGMLGRQMLSGFHEKSSMSGSSSPPLTFEPGLGRREMQVDRLVRRPASDSAGSIPKLPTSGDGIAPLFVKILAGLLWPVAFFVLGSFSTSAIVLALSDGDQEARQQAVLAAGRASGVPLFIGSIALTIVLAKLGWLPGFRRRKVAATDHDPSLVRPGSGDSRVVAGR